MAGRPTEPTHPTPSVWTDLALEDDVRIPLPGGKGAMLFRRIPAGEFSMGSRGRHEEEPRHRVVIPAEYWLGKFVVTRLEWAVIVDTCSPAVHRSGNREPITARPNFFEGAKRPIEKVAWDECVAWCAAWQASLNREQPLEWDPEYRIGLPSEAQWEHACRAGADTDYWNGDGQAALREVGWFADNSGGQTHDVDEPVVSGSPERHPAGLIGMHGNVWEWCADAFDADAYRKREDAWRAAEPWGSWDAASLNVRSRAVRGGSWHRSAWRCRSAYRSGRKPGVSYDRQSFRVCLVRGPGSASSGGEAAAPRRKTKAAPAAKGSKKPARAVKKAKAARRKIARKTKRKATPPAPKARPQQKPAKKKGAGKRRGRGKRPGGGP